MGEWVGESESDWVDEVEQNLGTPEGGFHLIFIHKTTAFQKSGKKVCEKVRKKGSEKVGEEIKKEKEKKKKKLIDRGGGEFFF